MDFIISTMILHEKKNILPDIALSWMPWLLTVVNRTSPVIPEIGCFWYFMCICNSTVKYLTSIFLAFQFLGIPYMIAFL